MYTRYIWKRRFCGGAWAQRNSSSLFCLRASNLFSKISDAIKQFLHNETRGITPSWNTDRVKRHSVIDMPSSVACLTTTDWINPVNESRTDSNLQSIHKTCAKSNDNSDCISWSTILLFFSFYFSYDAVFKQHFYNENGFIKTYLSEVHLPLFRNRIKTTLAWNLFLH